MYFLKSVRKGHFRNECLGGRSSHFSAQRNTLDTSHKQCTAPLNHLYSESSSPSALPFSGRAGTPLGHTSPCLWTATYFFNFSQSCDLRAFTGTQPSLRGIAQRPSVVSTCRLLGLGSARLFGPATRLVPSCTHFTPPERALLRSNCFCGASGEVTARGVNLQADMVAAC